MVFMEKPELNPRAYVVKICILFLLIERQLRGFSVGKICSDRFFELHRTGTHPHTIRKDASVVFDYFQIQLRINPKGRTEKKQQPEDGKYQLAEEQVIDDQIRLHGKPLYTAEMFMNVNMPGNNHFTFC